MVSGLVSVSGADRPPQCVFSDPKKIPTNCPKTGKINLIWADCFGRVIDPGRASLDVFGSGDGSFFAGHEHPDRKISLSDGAPLLLAHHRQHMPGRQVLCVYVCVHA